MTSIDKIDLAIGRYYKSLGANYNEQFAMYCRNNGIDDEVLESEIVDSGPCDSFLVEFDDNFPFAVPPNNEETKQQYIHSIISKCYNNSNVSFGPTMPQLNEEFFKITKNELQAYSVKLSSNYPQKDRYILYHSSCTKLLQIMAIEDKHKFEYLLHLFGCFSRDLTKQIKMGGGSCLDIKNWCNMEMNKHFKAIKDLACYAMIQCAFIRLYTYCRHVILPPPIFTFKQKKMVMSWPEMNDSLEITARYICAATEFVGCILSKQNTPFQLELCIFYNEIDSDITQDIEGKLKQNKLKYKHIGINTHILCEYNTNLIVSGWIRVMISHKIESIDVPNDIMFVLFKYFGDWECYHRTENLFNLYCQFNRSINHKRFVIFIDRTKRCQHIEDLWIYECPADCSDIPKQDVLPYWYFNATQTCVLPERLRDPDHMRNWCRGHYGYLLFSFHVKELDRLQCYLWCGGDVLRFMPQDIDTVLPELFNMEWNDKNNSNKKFIQNHKLKNRLVDTMNNILIDKYFERFCSLYQ